MKPNEVFEVNATRKKLEGAAAIFIGVFILGVIISYFVFLRKLDLFEGTVIASIVSSVKSQITAFSLIGSWYVAFFGGLFFIFVPLEIYFITAIKNDPWIVYLVFLFGISISYSLDYLIGVKLSKVSRKLISPKKFYTVKSYLNTHGKLGIFLPNFIPSLSNTILFTSAVIGLIFRIMLSA